MTRKSLERLSDSELYELYRNKQYDRLRTGLTFKSVRRDLAVEQRAKKGSRGKGCEYMFVTRRTVLGRWHEIKQDMFRYLENEDVSREEMLNYLSATEITSGE